MIFMMSSAGKHVTSSSSIPPSVLISTSASSSSSSPSVMYGSLQYSPHPHVTNPSSNQAKINHPPSKKRRNLPGNPDPDAEVIALSPRTLMATNRFMCELCNKGFQRDQNLQLHRRGHNLPWKLKQRANKEGIRKKVYVCPEPGCVHNDRLRALGDLTGIKKHYSRKHGEKKWRCDKCSKRYAVQSDWKAHSKVCGTKEYRCDCGTLFSRRDSFITHRAFCDALLADEESARSTTTLPNPTIPTPQSQPLHHLPLFTPLKQEEQHPGNTSAPPPWLSTSPVFPSVLDQGFSDQEDFVNPNPRLGPSIFTASQFQIPTATLPSSNMSATALLQKAAQMGATMSSCASIQDGIMPSSYSNDAFGGMFGLIKDEVVSVMDPKPVGPGGCSGGGGAGRDSDGNMTRDFLGLRPGSHDSILNIVGIGSCINGQVERHQGN
ncbi:hypothetical protein MLD38_005202 [Melastoma candidum]|uniref:Uncharacterized protein n=1 Tax=Melastoma candidum TaxID=119954 RepID=A0ACB9SC13_9MYRT|nr:hypothetical protein MLD38_005202 [Melastoma candidum]